MTNDRVKFISTTFLKEYSPLSKNIDDDLLIPFIYRSQDINLQTILGSDFFDRLKEGVINNDLNSDEENLIRNYIQNMVAEWTIYYSLPTLNFKLTNKSVTQDRSEFGDPSGLDEIKYLRQNVRDMAEFYSKRLVKYLVDYGTQLFPEYRQTNSKENLNRNSKSYFNGIYIPKRGPQDFVSRSYNDPTEGDDYCYDC
jgi:hypothetical protein